MYLIDIFCTFSLGLPFNTKTPIGYAIAFLILGPLSIAVLRATIHTIIFLLRYFFLMMSFGRNLCKKFHDLDENFSKINTKIQNDLCQAISFHTEVKQLSIKNERKVRLPFEKTFIADFFKQPIFILGLPMNLCTYWNSVWRLCIFGVF